MTTSSDAADKLVSMYLDGIQIVLRVSGVATKNVIAALYAVSQDKQKTKGKIRLSNMLKTGKELKIFSVKKEDLKRFSQEARRYGVLYCALVNKKNLDGMVDIMVRAEDASKINRIVERFNLTTIDTAEIKREIEEHKNLDIGVEEKSEEDKLIDDILSKPIAKEENENTPSITRTEDTQLESYSNNNLKTEGTVKNTEKPSVRKELIELKKEVETEEKQNKILEIIKELNYEPKHIKIKSNKVSSRAKHSKRNKKPKHMAELEKRR